MVVLSASLARSKAYFFAVGASSITAAVKVTLLHTIAGMAPFLLSIFPVIASSLYGGFWPGITSLVTSSILVNYFFLPPLFSLQFSPTNIFPTSVFVVEGVIIAFLIHRQKRSAQETHELTTNLERKVAHRTRDIQRFNIELQRSNKELEDFAHIASHDLQEPLRKIQAFSNLLIEEHAEKLDEDAKYYVERMLAASQRMRHLIDDLLTYSRVSSKPQELTKLSLAKIVSEVLEDLEVRIAELRAVVNVEPLPEIEADPLQMQQLFQNLLSNSLKFHKANVPPVINISSNEIEKVIPGKNNKFVEISITDNGIGFEKKYHDRIFTLFERLHSKTEYAGTGIGLAVCKKIVERHGGTLHAKSTINLGTTFYITLPYVQKHRRALPWKQNDQLSS